MKPIVRMSDVLRGVTITVCVEWPRRQRMRFSLGMALIRLGCRIAGLGGVQIAEPLDAEAGRE